MKKERLAIAFPIWGIFDTSASGAYHDPEKMMAEHAERGFNCVRLEDGAGLMHDLSGARRGPAKLGSPFGEVGFVLRQQDVIGGDGYCDVRARLLALARAAKKNGIKLILSSWYYLHTYWWTREPELNRLYFSMPPHERFMAFAKLLDYILVELEEAGLADVVAFAEILNETNGLSFYSGQSREEKELFVRDHTEAIAFLKERHPEIDFAYDCFMPGTEGWEVPTNIQVLNFHNYYLWAVYDALEKHDMSAYYKETPVKRADVENYRPSRGLLMVGSEDWYDRCTLYGSLDPKYLPELSSLLENNLAANIDLFKSRLASVIGKVKEMSKRFPEADIVSGEGMTYCGARWLTWEENSDLYWEMVKYTMDSYKEAGFRGSVIKTCLGPEDPSWNMCKDRIRALNERFLKD